ncbi:MAG: nitrilase-related carbon-nitrogen hydrolase [Phenylobacterium sp.]
MADKLIVAAAQLGPNPREPDRERAVARMIALLEQAAAAGARLVTFPEMALTCYFPAYVIDDPAELDRYCEREMPGPATRPLFDAARRLGVGFYLGYAEKTPDGRRFNSAVLVDERGEVAGKYRKVHLPGYRKPQPDVPWQALEKRYFEVGDLGFPVFEVMGLRVGMCICNDRRWVETFRVMGLAGADLVLLGYNTPLNNPFGPDWETDELRMRQSLLCTQAGAYQNACYVVAAAKAGDEGGCPFMAGSAIASPTGEILALAATCGDELVLAEIDLAVRRFYAGGLFNFPKHRRPEHYGPITER